MDIIWNEEERGKEKIYYVCFDAKNKYLNKNFIIIDSLFVIVIKERERELKLKYLLLKKNFSIKVSSFFVFYSVLVIDFFMSFFFFHYFWLRQQETRLIAADLEYCDDFMVKFVV